MLRRANRRLARTAQVSILTGPGGPVLPVVAPALLSAPVRVSILTGPGGPVLPGVAVDPGGVGDVSILTGPGGPVLRICVRYMEGSHRVFQSSPGPEARCYSRSRVRAASR